MNSQYFEVTFRTSPVTEEQEIQLSEGHDAFVGGHGDVTLVTIGGSFADCDGAGAAVELAQRLRDFGLEVQRVETDYVTGPVIAERCGETRQAVNQWIRKVRFAETPFPAPRNLAAGGLFRWNEVNEWLRDRGKKYDADVRYLTADEEIIVNYRLTARKRADVAMHPFATYTSTVHTAEAHPFQPVANWSLVARQKVPA